MSITFIKKKKHKIQINILISILIVVTLFHLCVIAKIVPYEIAWGGRLQNDSEMYVFETFSILINLFLGIVLLMKGDYIRFQLKKKTIDIILWIFVALFALNTIGNLFAKTNFEKSFAVLTLALAILIWTILKPKNIQNTNT
jgi:membrane protease YdiL (CAAX protease family)